MSFREWLYDHLMEDGVIDDTYEMSEISTEVLLSETALDDYEIDIYKQQFEESCRNVNEEPVWDFD